MSTNKTWLAFEDYNSTSAPHGISGQLEFEVYEDALNYGKSFLKGIQNGGGVRINIYLFNYSRQSYILSVNSAGVLGMTEIDFPWSWS